MRKLLVLLAFLLLPFALSAGEPEERYWFCRQNGNVDEQLTMAVSCVWEDDHSNHYTERESAFEAHVMRVTDGHFEPSFQAKCREYSIRRDAVKHRRVEIDTAKRYLATVLELDWRWIPDGKGNDRQSP